MRRSNPRIFLKRKTKTHFEKRKKYFLTGPECFTSFVFYVFYTTSKAKTNWGKSNFPFKNVSAWCSTKSKLQTGFEKENTPLMSFMAVFGGVSVYFVGRRLPCPECKTAHSMYSASSGQHFIISFSSQEGRLFLCRCFVGRTLILACMHRHKNI